MSLAPPLLGLICVLGSGLFLYACNQSGGSERQTQEAEAKSARQLVTDGATLLDVRTPQEYEAGHLNGALLIPIAELEGRVTEVPQDKPVVVYCRSGGRSTKAAHLLKERGYTVHNLGPMSAW